MSLTNLENERIKVCWTMTPFAHAFQVRDKLAEQYGKGHATDTLIKRWPHRRYNDLGFRSEQAAYALHLHEDDLTYAEIEELTSISTPTLKKVHDFLTAHKGIKIDSQHVAQIYEVLCDQCNSIHMLGHMDWDSIVCENCDSEIRHPDLNPAPTEQLVEERGVVYGHPLEDFRRNAAIEEVIAECKDPEIRHAIRMVWVKCCRLIETPDHRDSIDDIKGYAETMHMILDGRKVKGGKLSS